MPGLNALEVLFLLGLTMVLVGLGVRAACFLVAEFRQLRKAEQLSEPDPAPRPDPSACGWRDRVRIRLKRQNR